jgi:hypothetical protein
LVVKMASENPVVGLYANSTGRSETWVIAWRAPRLPRYSKDAGLHPRHIDQRPGEPSCGPIDRTKGVDNRVEIRFFETIYTP